MGTATVFRTRVILVLGRRIVGTGLPSAPFDETLASMATEQAVPEKVRGTNQMARLPLVLSGVLLASFVLTLATTPAGTLNWFLEVGPGLVGMVVLAATFRRFPLSRFVYVCVFLHILVLVFGAQWTYALNPFGEWMKGAFGFSRNNYDKIGHFAQGFFPVFVISEVLLRTTPLRSRGWIGFLSVSVALAISAFYEMFEWWSAVLLDPEGGDKFLGTQGYVWDAQSDMFMCLIGAVVGYVALGWIHARSMQRLDVQGSKR